MPPKKFHPPTSSEELLSKSSKKLLKKLKDALDSVQTNSLVIDKNDKSNIQSLIRKLGEILEKSKIIGT